MIASSYRTFVLTIAKTYIMNWKMNVTLHLFYHYFHRHHNDVIVILYSFKWVMKNLFVLSSPVYSQLSKNLHRLGRWIHACFTLKYIYKSQDIITTYEISLEHIYLDRFFSSTSFWQDFNYLWHNEKILYDINQGSNCVFLV